MGLSVGKENDMSEEKANTPDVSLSGTLEKYLQPLMDSCLQYYNAPAQIATLIFSFVMCSDPIKEGNVYFGKVYQDPDWYYSSILIIDKIINNNNNTIDFEGINIWPRLNSISCGNGTFDRNKGTIEYVEKNYHAKTSTKNLVLPTNYKLQLIIDPLLHNNNNSNNNNNNNSDNNNNNNSNDNSNNNSNNDDKSDKNNKKDAVQLFANYNMILEEYIIGTWDCDFRGGRYVGNINWLFHIYEFDRCDLQLFINNIALFRGCHETTWEPPLHLLGKRDMNDGKAKKNDNA